MESTTVIPMCRFGGMFAKVPDEPAAWAREAAAVLGGPPCRLQTAVRAAPGGGAAQMGEAWRAPSPDSFDQMRRRGMDVKTLPMPRFCGGKPLESDACAGRAAVAADLEMAGAAAPAGGAPVDGGGAGLEERDADGGRAGSSRAPVDQPAGPVAPPMPGFCGPEVRRHMEEQAEWECGAPAAWTPYTPIIAGSAVASVAQAWAPPEMPRWNVGSFGHPHLCGRPCLHTFSGCAHGLSCEFCHIPHEPSHHLDKQRRVLMRGMPPEECQAMMMPLIAQKVLSINSTDSAMFAFRRLVATCGVDGTAQQRSLEPREHRRLVKGLRGMTLRHLLTVFIDLMQRHGAEEARQAAQALLDTLLSALVHSL